MSEEPPSYPEAKPTNHGHFEGPATEQDYEDALQMDPKQVAQLKYQERTERAQLASHEADKYDEITGLPYGKKFREEVNKALQTLNPENRRGLTPNNALIVNLDGKGLKDINDRLGHENGNIMLYNIGQILKAVARPGDLVGRWGESSDEFGAVFFFRDDQSEPEKTKEAIDERLLFLAEHAVKMGEIGGLRWCSTFYEPGQDFRYHLAKAEPSEKINPGLVVEYPPKNVMPNRDDRVNLSS